MITIPEQISLCTSLFIQGKKNLKSRITYGIKYTEFFFFFSQGFWYLMPKLFFKRVPIYTMSSRLWEGTTYWSGNKRLFLSKYILYFLSTNLIFLKEKLPTLTCVLPAILFNSILIIGKDLDAGKDWGQEKKRTTEDEMVGWHHQLNRHEFEQIPEDSEGQGSLACCSPWGPKELDMTERLNKEKEGGAFFSHFRAIC